jgi:predicted dehydrogenase
VPGIADVAFVSMEFGDGPIANVELSWLAPSKLRRTVIVGSKKMVVYEDGSPEPVKIYDRGVEYEDPQTFGEWHLSYRSGDILTPKLASDEPLTVELGAFVQAMRSGQAAAADLQLARDVVRLAEAADDSLSNGGVQIELSEMTLRAA